MAIFQTKANRCDFCVLEPLLQITRGTKTSYIIIEPVWPRTKRRVNHLYEQFATLGPRGWTPDMKGVGMLGGNFELNP